VIQESRIMVPARTTAAVSSAWVEYCLARTAELGWFWAVYGPL